MTHEQYTIGLMPTLWAIKNETRLFCDNSIKYWPIFVIFSLLYTTMNGGIRTCCNILGEKDIIFNQRGPRPNKLTEGPGWLRYATDSDAQGWASECPDVKNCKWRLNPVWHKMLYGCNLPIATVVDCAAGCVEGCCAGDEVTVELSATDRVLGGWTPSAAASALVPSSAAATTAPVVESEEQARCWWCLDDSHRSRRRRRFSASLCIDIIMSLAKYDIVSSLKALL